MSHADTAVMEPETAATEQATEETPDSAISQATENEGQPETTDSENETPTLTQKDLDAAVKAAQAKADESYRQKLESKEQEIRDQAQAAVA